MTKTELVYVTSLREGLDSMEFIRRVMRTPELHRDFTLSRGDASDHRGVLRDWIEQRGMSSLFSFHRTHDAVMDPGYTVDEIETLILTFVRKLAGIKNLFIIDPYLYSSEQPVVALFKAMMSELAGTLESVTFFTKPFRNPKDLQRFDSTAMHAALRSAVPSITIKDVKTDEFHDRFWIDADSHKGIVMGTSLNGVKKKYALIDYLRHADAKVLADAARSVI